MTRSFQLLLLLTAFSEVRPLRFNYTASSYAAETGTVASDADLFDTRNQEPMTISKAAWGQSYMPSQRMNMLTADQKDAIACFLKESVPIRMTPSDLEGHAPFSTCAVVSSSGALSHHNYGTEIDDHAAVIRFNDAPTAGYSAYVGSKDSIRVLNKQGLDRLGSMNADTLYVWADPLHSVSSAKDQSSNQSNVYELAEDAQKLATDAIQEIYSGRWFNIDHAQAMEATTGSLGMLIALANCDTVDAYEMTNSRYSASSPYHYYSSPENGLRANQNSWHRTFSAEHDLWERIATSPEDASETGKVGIKGFSQLECDRVEKLIPVSFSHQSSASARAREVAGKSHGII